MTYQRPITRGPSPVPGIAMTPWVRRWASRLADVHVPEGTTVAMSARSARGPFVANIYFREGDRQPVQVWHHLPEMAIRLALIEAGVARCERCGEPDDGFHWTTHETVIRADADGYVTEISDASRG